MRVPIDIEVINSALVQFEVRNGYLPVDLMEVEESGMISLSKDPWGSDYQYAPNARVNRRVFSMGADGEIGGEGLAADIYIDTDIKKLIAQY
ncbi:MAG: type II secretion system protein GspG [Kangiellaceae bacterium]